MMESGSFQWCRVTGPEATAQTEMQEIPSEHQETLFYCEGDQAPIRVAWRGDGVSIFGDIQKPSGHGPGKLVLEDPA